MLHELRIAVPIPHQVTHWLLFDSQIPQRYQPQQCFRYSGWTINIIWQNDQKSLVGRIDFIFSNTPKKKYSKIPTHVLGIQPTRLRRAHHLSPWWLALRSQQSYQQTLYISKRLWWSTWPYNRQIELVDLSKTQSIDDSRSHVWPVQVYRAMPQLKLQISINNLRSLLSMLSALGR